MKSLKLNPNFNLTANQNFKIVVCYQAETKEYKRPKMSRFELWQSEKNNLFYWNLKSGNGRIILKCLKGYNTENEAIENINTVCHHGTDVDNFEVETENRTEGGLYYILFNDIGKNIAISGNGKGYNLKAENKVKYNIALKQQVQFNGVNQGILSTVKNIQDIVTKEKPILFLE